MAPQLRATAPKTLCLCRRQNGGAAARRPMVTFRCSAAARSCYNITLLPGDGIGPEVVDVAKDVLFVAGAKEGKQSKLNSPSSSALSSERTSRLTKTRCFLLSGRLRAPLSGNADGRSGAGRGRGAAPRRDARDGAGLGRHPSRRDRRVSGTVC